MMAERDGRSPVVRKPARRSTPPMRVEAEKLVAGLLSDAIEQFAIDLRALENDHFFSSCYALKTLLRPIVHGGFDVALAKTNQSAGNKAAHADVKPLNLLEVDRLLVNLVRHGLPPASCLALIDENILTKSELHRLVIKPRTLQHRLKDDKPLSPEESDKAVRVARVWDEACEVFGSMEKAGRWLRRPTRQLGGETPMDLLDTEIGARQVENALGEIAHGMAA